MKSLHEILERSVDEDLEPLRKYLKTPRFAVTQVIESELREAAGHTLNIFTDKPDYREIVEMVAKRIKVHNFDTIKNGSVETIEDAIIHKLFEDAWERMSEDERKEFLRNMNIPNYEEYVFASYGAIATLLAASFGGFYTFQLAVIVANLVARALLGAGLAFAGNVLLTRTLGILLGPIGWIATGLWLVFDLGGPAYRKIVPSVVHIALLRKIVEYTLNIGIVGDASSGKDAGIRSIFGIDTGKINPIAGSTTHCEIYDLPLVNQTQSTGNVKIVNYPGFNDPNGRDDSTNAQLCRTDVFILVVDINRGITDVDKKIYQKLSETKRPTLVCLNKIDLPRKNDLEALKQNARKQLPGAHFIEVAFDPDPRLWDSKKDDDGLEWVRKWIGECVEESGKGQVAWRTAAESISSALALGGGTFRIVR